MKLDPYLIPYTKINLKWMHRLKHKSKNCKTSKQKVNKQIKIEENIRDLKLGTNFSSRKQKV